MNWFANFESARLQEQRDDEAGERDAAALRKDDGGDNGDDGDKDDGPVSRRRSRWRLFGRRLTS